MEQKGLIKKALLFKISNNILLFMFNFVQFNKIIFFIFVHVVITQIRDTVEIFYNAYVLFIHVAELMYGIL